MELGKQGLKGSPSRDEFKRRHKDLSATFYAGDLDFVLVTKYPKAGIVAFLDYKRCGDQVTFAEAIAYNSLLSIAPVYIVQGDNPNTGPFTVLEYKGGDWRPEPPVVSLIYCETVQDWRGFGNWERRLRAKHLRAHMAS